MISVEVVPAEEKPWEQRTPIVFLIRADDQALRLSEQYARDLYRDLYRELGRRLRRLDAP